MAYPTDLDSTTTIPVESASTPLSTNHVTNHTASQTAIIAIESKVGVDGSAVTTSHDYKLGEVTSTDKAVGKTATQTLTNKTLTGATLTTSTVNGVTLTAAGAATDYLSATGAYSTGAFCPTGAVSPYAGAVAPAGWLLADGAAVSRTTYSALFAITSTTYGVGDGSTTFNVPDLRGRVAVGKSADTEFDALGETGGEKTHVLTEAELAAHTHTVPLVSGSPVGGATGIFSTTHVTNANVGPAAETSSSTGSGTAHNNLQPYITLNYIIKI